MTRETRIGLIVGLAFIVLFGVVLSELGTSSEPTPGRSERASNNFYVRAPVTSHPTPQGREELSLSIPRRTTVTPPRRQTPPTGIVQSPPRRTSPPTGIVQSPPRRTVQPIGGSGRREMTAEEFAASHGVGAGRRTRARMYVTRRGDNLTAIARKFYRTPSRKAVMKIFNANRNVLRTPDSLGVGVKIVIPN
jgi:nucleoid-associated protein YgaU